MKCNWVVVLSDGETYTSLEGCQLVCIPEDLDEYCYGDADDFKDDVTDALGEDEAKRLIYLDLQDVLRHGYKLADYEKEAQPCQDKD
jgi:hypothetical protein